jgi:Flp pilus assembly protein TadG
MPHVGDVSRAPGYRERGVTAVFIAISMLGLLAMTAFAFDFGRMYIEREQLQLGADAAALAIASDCSQGQCGSLYDPSLQGELYADSNVNDGTARIQSIDLDVAARTVDVITGTEDAAGNNFLKTVFAPIVGFDQVTIGARATATWGPPSTLRTLPLIFSECEWQAFGEAGFVDENPLGFLHRAEAVTAGQLPPASGYPYQVKAATIFFHGSNGTCHSSPSGQDLPGGFGWLTTDPGVCDLTTTVGSWVTINPGSSPSQECNPSDIADLMGEVVIIPYFDMHTGTGNNAQYRVYGFGALYVTGYNFAGQYKGNSLINGKLPCSGNSRCIQGYFIGDWTATGGGSGGGPNLGVDIVQLTG